MKRKLRDLTVEELNKWKESNCGKILCRECVFNFTHCTSFNDNTNWINNKDQLSDNFLNQEIELEGESLTPEEKEHLKLILTPFKDKDIKIYKEEFYWDNERLRIIVLEKSENYNEIMTLIEKFDKNTKYKNLQYGLYTAEKLNIFE